MTDEVDFLPADKHQRFLQIGAIVLSIYGQTCPNYQNYQVWHFFAISKKWVMKVFGFFLHLLFKISYFVKYCNQHQEKHLHVRNRLNFYLHEKPGSLGNYVAKFNLLREL